jgi:hypothetical protein
VIYLDDDTFYVALSGKNERLLLIEYGITFDLPDIKFELIGDRGVG